MIDPRRRTAFLHVKLMAADSLHRLLAGQEFDNARLLICNHSYSSHNQESMQDHDISFV